VSDHPVCGAEVGYANIFVDAAATPPLEEGNITALSTHLNSFTPSKARDDTADYWRVTDPILMAVSSPSSIFT
jgi:hypothetical protein